MCTFYFYLNLIVLMVYHLGRDVFFQQVSVNMKEIHFLVCRVQLLFNDTLSLQTLCSFNQLRKETFSSSTSLLGHNVFKTCSTLVYGVELGDGLGNPKTWQPSGRMMREDTQC